MIRLVVCRGVGAILIAAAGALWFLLPDMQNDASRRLLVVPGPEMIYQVIRWLFIAIVGAAGALIWSLGHPPERR